MERSTIDFGIDLGTTNSAIAVLDGVATTVFKNNEQSETTPSVVWIDKKERLHVGQAAKDQLFGDPENSRAEFKLQMGRTQGLKFARSGRELRPEELSAEVLKSLREAVRQSAGQEVSAAAITVPADFDAPQNAATTKAAQLAGFIQSPLLQEPVAAAMAYGFQSTKDKVFWLVYDLGGGTFDAAVVQVRDGQIEVINHGGDKHLGGKNIDWQIVETVLAPAAAREASLGDFKRGEPRWLGAFAKLKQAAEKAKIRLSTAPSAQISIDFLCVDGRNETVPFEFELTRRHVEDIMEPMLTQTVNICRRVLAEKKLKPEHLERVLLVGGPTLNPYLRARLQDPRAGLGIRLDFSVDPMTVVARGAAIFAGTQRLAARAPAAAAAGEAVLELHYDPVSPNPEAPIAGRLVAPAAAAGMTIEFVNPDAQPPWRSGKIAVGPNGAFMGNLWSDEGRRNTFTIEVRDARGTLLRARPASVSVTLGNKPAAPRLTHGLGVAMGNNLTDPFFEKGTPLPARKRRVHRTIHAVRCGSGEELLRIPFVEGENRNADRNREVGSLVMPAAAIPRDLPAHSEVEITLEVDSSLKIVASAFVPFLNKEFETVLDLKTKEVSTDELRRRRDAACARLEELGARARELGGSGTVDAAGAPGAVGVLERIGQEQMEARIESLLRAAAADGEAADECRERVLKLNLALDELEAALEWPSLTKQADAKLKAAREVLERFGRRSEDRATAAALERELEAGVQAKDAAALRLRVEKLDDFIHALLRQQPGYWIEGFRWLEENIAQATDRAAAEALRARARKAIESDDISGLKDAVMQWARLMPEEKRARSPLGGGTILG